MLTCGSLFSGIGGIDLGLERAGWKCLWQVEIDPFCRKVLEKHWPHVPKYKDIRELTGGELDRVNLLAGGFPCQDLSLAGKGAGLAGERSGLWFEFLRLIRALRPRWVLVENVPGLFVRGFGTVLGGLAEAGYDAAWFTLLAADVGAPHRRERVFIVAYSPERENHGRGYEVLDEAERGREGFNPAADAGREDVADTAGDGLELRRCVGKHIPQEQQAIERGCENVADPTSPRQQTGTSRQSGAVWDEVWGQKLKRRSGIVGWREQRATQSCLGGMLNGLSHWLDRCKWPAGPGQLQYDWEPPRIARGVKDRVPRMKGLGNAVVPQVAELIGWVIRLIEEQNEALVKEVDHERERVVNLRCAVPD